MQLPPDTPAGAESLSIPTPTNPQLAATPRPHGGVVAGSSPTTHAPGTTPLPHPGTATHGSHSDGQDGNRPDAADRGPLTIGMVYPNNAGANAALGLTTSNSNDPKSLMNALVSGVNKAGGLAGRKLTVDYFPANSSLSNYDTQAQAACAHFTEDRPVPVVLDVAYGNKFGMAECLARHGVADFGLGTSDAVSDNKVGLYASPVWMSSTRRYPAVLDVLHSTGYLTSNNKIGVLLESCPDLQRAYASAVRPEISRLRLNVAATAELGCTSGFGSAGPASAAIQSAVLRFRSHQVDRVLIVSDFEQVALMLLANLAGSQDWHPGYMLSSAAEAEVIRPSIPKTQWPQLHGAGWSPWLDTDDPHQRLTSADRRCLGLIKKGGVTVSGLQNTYIATTECSTLFFLGAALQASRGDARGSALMAAVNSLGSSFDSPAVLDGRTFFGPERRDGPAAVAPFGYLSQCGCLKYTGRAVAAS